LVPDVAKFVWDVFGMENTRKGRPRLRAVAAQFLLGVIGLTSVTLVCFQLDFGVARTGFAYVILIALVSLLGSFSVSVILSIIAVACLNYFFTQPLFSFRVDDPDDIARIAAFWATSLVVTAVTTKLRASEARFRTFVDNSTDAFFLLDDDSTILDVNQQACDGLGYSREELIGKHRSDLDVGLDDASIASLKQRFVAEQVVTFETRHRRKDGTSFPVEVRVGQFEQGGRRFLCVARDITERKRAEEALRRSEAYLVEAQRLSHTGTIVFSATGPVYWSEESYRIWDLDPLQGLPDLETVLQRIHPDDRDRANKEAFEALHQGRNYAFEFRIVLADGTVKYLESTGHPLLSAGGQPEMVATHVDVTERKRAQEEHERLRQLEADLAHVNRISIMGELAASLAHEILHPIATARNNARAGMRFLELSPPNLGEVKEALACVVRDSDRAKDIVGRMRDHIKKAPPRREPFDLNEAIHEVIVTVGSAIDKNGVSVRTRLIKGLNPVLGDRVQVQQVVLNLILNSMEAMSSVDEGARELSISTKQGPKSDILVAVQDSGPGIDPEHLEQVFAPFYTTKTSGIGMGLSICRSIVAAHGGRLWAEASGPRGAIFQFTLPAGHEDS
jgi:PAS domain S-box-containing protein